MRLFHLYIRRRRPVIMTYGVDGKEPSSTNGKLELIREELEAFEKQCESAKVELEPPTPGKYFDLGFRSTGELPFHGSVTEESITVRRDKDGVETITVNRKYGGKFFREF